MCRHSVRILELILAVTGGEVGQSQVIDRRGGGVLMCDHTMWPKHKHNSPVTEFISILQREEKVSQALQHPIIQPFRIRQYNLNLTHKLQTVLTKHW